MIDNASSRSLSSFLECDKSSDCCSSSSFFFRSTHSPLRCRMRDSAALLLRLQLRVEGEEVYKEICGETGFPRFCNALANHLSGVSPPSFARWCRCILVLAFASSSSSSSWRRRKILSTSCASSRTVNASLRDRVAVRLGVSRSSGIPSVVGRATSWAGFFPCGEREGGGGGGGVPVAHSVRVVFPLSSTRNKHCGPPNPCGEAGWWWWWWWRCGTSLSFFGTSFVGGVPCDCRGEKDCDIDATIAISVGGG